MLAVGFSITLWGRSLDTQLASTPFPAPGAGSLQRHQEGTGAAGSSVSPCCFCIPGCQDGAREQDRWDVQPREVVSCLVSW